MDDDSVRQLIFEVAKNLGVKLRSVYRNPLKNVWYIHRQSEIGIIYLELVPGSDIERVAGQINDLLNPSKTIQSLEKTIDNLRSRDPDRIFGAMQLLKLIGEPAVQPLINLLFGSKRTELCSSPYRGNSINDW